MAPATPYLFNEKPRKTNLDQDNTHLDLAVLQFCDFIYAFAAITNQLGIWLWLGFGLIFAEGLILLMFKLSCPLTVVARRFSDSEKANFDIFLPNWLARNNKSIYTLIFAAIVLITLRRRMS